MKKFFIEESIISPLVIQITDPVGFFGNGQLNYEMDIRRIRKVGFGISLNPKSLHADLANG